MDLRHLRYFVAVAEEKSFLRASERLHISQPPLSTQIKDLERTVGATLFERSSRGVNLTAAGTAFYAEAVAILARLEHAKIAVSRVAHGEQGNLKLGFVAFADYSVLPSTLCHFKNQFPSIDVQLHQLDTDAQLRELEAENIDVGMTTAPVDGSKLAFTTLHEEGLVLAVPESRRFTAKSNATSLEEFARERFIMTPRSIAPGLHDLAISFCKEVGFVPMVSQYANHLQTVIGLVSSGLGVALVPKSMQNYQRSGVSYLLPKERSPQLRLGLCHRAQDQNPVVQTFLKCAKELATSDRKSTRELVYS